MSLTPRFTPSLLSHETLERLFVARDEQFNQLMERIQNAAQRGGLIQSLLVGPRGAGKTHLLSLAVHRTKALPAFGQRLVVSWLPEDPWGITTFDSLMESIHENMEPRHEADSNPSMIKVVFIENFDWILEALGRDGQRQLRARIEGGADLLLVATSTRLSRHILEQAAPFYCFFNPMQLNPFSLEEAMAMLENIAALEGDEKTAGRLHEPDVRARLAAVEQLAGGQPRIWAFLASGLALDRVGDLTVRLIEGFDDLIPYYQEQMQRLSPAERKVVFGLMEADGAMTVKGLAEKTGIQPRSLAKTLHNLTPTWVMVRSGYLTRFADKRLTWYQLAEPLARIAHQIKASRGKPVKAVLDFLTAWFTREQLRDEMDRWQEDPCTEETDPGEKGWEGLLTDSFAAPEEMTKHYIREATVMAASPGNRFREMMIRNMISFHNLNGDEVQDEKTGLKGEDRDLFWPDGSALQMMEKTDDALRELQMEKKSVSLLSLPPGISGLIEKELEDEQDSVGMQRLKLAVMAVGAGGGDEWVDRGYEAIPAVKEGQRLLARMCLLSILFGRGLFSAGLDLMNQVDAGTSAQNSRDKEPRGFEGDSGVEVGLGNRSEAVTPAGFAFYNHLAGIMEPPRNKRISYLSTDNTALIADLSMGKQKFDSFIVTFSDAFDRLGFQLLMMFHARPKEKYSDILKTVEAQCAGAFFDYCRDNILRKLTHFGENETERENVGKIFGRMVSAVSLLTSLSPMDLDEFAMFIYRRDEEIREWFEENIPDYQEREEYLKFRGANPSAGEADLLAEYGVIKWLEINRPDFETFMEEEAAEYAALAEKVWAEQMNQDVSPEKE